MSDKEYKILEVQERNRWSGKFGDFQDYAVKLEGVDNWVQLSQKPETPAPEVNGTLYGHLETQTRGDKTFMKFKKAQRPDGNSGGSAAAGGDMKYVIQMLEELTGRRDRVVTADEYDAAEAKKAETGEDPIDLAEIPF